MFNEKECPRCKQTYWCEICLWSYCPKCADYVIKVVRGKSKKFYLCPDPECAEIDQRATLIKHPII